MRAIDHYEDWGSGFTFTRESGVRAGWASRDPVYPGELVHGIGMRSGQLGIVIYVNHNVGVGTRRGGHSESTVLWSVP